MAISGRRLVSNGNEESLGQYATGWERILYVMMSRQPILILNMRDVHKNLTDYMSEFELQRKREDWEDSRHPGLSKQINY